MCLFLTPQPVFSARHPRREPEWGQSAAPGESSPPTAWARPDWSVLWGVCVRGYAVFTFSSHAPSPGACLISHVPAGGGRFVCGLAPQWHFQLNQPAAISPCYLLKSARHFAAAQSDPRPTPIPTALWTDRVFCATTEQFKWWLLELPPPAFSYVGTLCARVRPRVLVLICVFVCDVCRQTRDTHNIHIKPAERRATAVQLSGLRNRTAVLPETLSAVQVSLGNLMCTISILTSLWTQTDTTSNSHRREMICHCFHCECSRNYYWKLIFVIIIIIIMLHS